jgi:hypothetical protein
MTVFVFGGWRSLSTCLLQRKICPGSSPSYHPLCTLYSCRRKQSTTKKTEEPTTTTVVPHQTESTAYLRSLNRTVDNLTGVDEISALKHAVANASRNFDTATARVQEMRRQLDQRTAHYQQLSQQHADMMNRRHEWTDQSVHEFASLTAAEGRARQTADQSRESVREAEANLHEAQNHYMDALRRRYHEEQVWNDKWRVLGTYYTWALIALNSAVFVGGQLLYYRREGQRLMAIQNMLQGLKDNATITSATATTAGLSSTAKLMDESGKQAEGPAADDDTKETSKTNTDNMNKERTEDASMETTVPSAAANNLEETRPSKSIKLVDRARTMWSDRDKLISQLHWPSVALGAAAATATLGVLVVSSFHRRI